MPTGYNIKRIRELKGLSVQQLADKMGKGKQNIYNWESGETEPELDSLKLLSKALDTTIDQLIDEVKDENHTSVHKTSDNNGNLDPEEDRVLRELIERNDKYRLVPTIILTEYEILSKNEIASRESLLQELIASQRVVIASKNDVITELKKEIDLLKSGQILLPPKQTEKDLAVRNT